MGQFITLAGVNPPSDRPDVTALDPVLPQSGAILLIDPTHPSGKWANGVPANAAVLPNIAASQAKTLLGLTSESEAAAVVTRGAPTTASAGLLERTAKGGLHYATSQTVDPNGHRLSVSISNQQAMREFILANTAAAGGSTAGAHQFYMSMWNRVTRVAKAGSITYAAEITAVAAPSTNRLAMMGQGTGYDELQTGTLGPQFVSLATNKNWAGTKPTSYSSAIARFFLLGIGDMYDYTDTFRLGKPSRVGYRFYLEDLTASGRTYDQVRAADYAYYQREVLTAGGRFYNDTFTNPSTLD